MLEAGFCSYFDLFLDAEGLAYPPRRKSGELLPDHQKQLVETTPTGLGEPAERRGTIVKLENRKKRRPVTIHSTI